MTLETLWKEYGWLGFLAWVSITQVWPFVRDRYFPAHMKNKMKEQQAKWEEKEFEMKEHLEDKLYERKLEERSVQANERFATAMEAIQKLLVAQNERMNSLLQVHLEHDRFTKEALLQMSMKTSANAIIAETGVLGRRKTDTPGPIISE